MRPGAYVSTLAWNEVRALLPTWVACVLTAGIAAVSGGEIHMFSLIAFTATAVGLGAQAVGHEYGHRTLISMLALPVGRGHLLLAKLVVLAAMVLPLAVFASVSGLFAGHQALPWLVAAGTLCLAPPLTMVCRNQLAGLVFSLTVPGMVLVLVMIATHTASAEAVLDTWSQLMIPVLAGGAALGWWLFMRLEAIEDGPGAIQWRWFYRLPRKAAPRSARWQLVKKELRLQLMTFAVTAMYLAACIVASLVDVPLLDPHVSPIGALTVIFELGISVLVGSLATAEERQLGTLAWQLELPWAAWDQWAVKVATVFSIALLLPIGVPVLLVPALWPGEQPLFEVPVILAVVATAVGMYVSSLCATAVRAVVTSTVVLSFVLSLVLRPELWTGRERGSTALLALASTVLVVFAFVNHRPEQPPASRIWRQSLSVAALVGFGLVVLGTVPF